MSQLLIEGGYPLCGVIDVQGAKNSVLPILSAALMSDGECSVLNFPEITDTYVAIDILRALGAKVVKQQDCITINAKNADGYEIPYGLMRKMRSSIMFLGSILAKNKKAVISLPGGCELGQRPIDIHLAALRKMGVNIEENHGFLECSHSGLKGCEISLSFPSVGATENIMLAAVKADGVTDIYNAAREPEIEDLARFLVKMGARIKGAGTDHISIEGVSSLSGCTHRVIPDRIVAGTYLCAVAATRGNALLKNICPLHIYAVTSLLKEAGCDIKIYDDAVSIECDKLKSVPLVRTMPYPGFPTDEQAPFMALMSIASGNTLFIETIFENRFKHVGELLRMGAKITTEGRVSLVEGVKKLHSATVQATDLRGGAGLAVAALAAEGSTVISSVEHIYRGYENFEYNISELGGKIKKI
ncbi:MAG: UDP-N-acetylglucosamine 1-carboxyvinyltransferase [Clostridiales bacterium]|nr:UDP-N-acetylglucosamine 1-carboxyvinyltransferase [Clostridiales bacterium]